jgi:hypothetical protein
LNARRYVHARRVLVSLALGVRGADGNASPSQENPRAAKSGSPSVMVLLPADRGSAGIHEDGVLEIGARIPAPESFRDVAGKRQVGRTRRHWARRTLLCRQRPPRRCGRRRWSSPADTGRQQADCARDECGCMGRGATLQDGLPMRQRTSRRIEVIEGIGGIARPPPGLTVHARANVGVRIGEDPGGGRFRTVRASNGILRGLLCYPGPLVPVLRCWPVRLILNDVGSDACRCGVSPSWVLRGFRFDEHLGRLSRLVIRGNLHHHESQLAWSAVVGSIAGAFRSRSPCRRTRWSPCRMQHPVRCRSRVPGPRCERRRMSTTSGRW